MNIKKLSKRKDDLLMEASAISESGVWNKLSEDEKQKQIANNDAIILIDTIEKLNCDNYLMKRALTRINNLAVGFIEAGPYIDNEPPIVCETMYQVERMSSDFVGYGEPGQVCDDCKYNLLSVHKEPCCSCVVLDDKLNNFVPAEVEDE